MRRAPNLDVVDHHLVVDFEEKPLGLLGLIMVPVTSP